jgi:uncharacterized membrane protein YciS (DUF1049 family)
MARIVELNFDPDERTLRQFGFIALFGFSVLALLAFFERAIFAFGLGQARPAVALTLGILSVCALAFSLLWPRGNWPLYVGLSVVTFPIGFVLSYVILAILFFLVIAPIGALLRVLGRDPLARGYDPSALSYFQKCRPARPKAHYFRQF